MRRTLFSLLIFFPLFICLTFLPFCTDNVPTDDANENTDAVATPVSAFDEFNKDAVTVSFNGDEIIIESTGLPNHVSPYWRPQNSLYIDPILANESNMSPGFILESNLTATLPAAPEKASKNSATGLGPIGIAITGAPIYNDLEGPNTSLTERIAIGFDYAGGHVGPTGYHYHAESFDVEANTVLSHDDDQLVGILADGFLIYGRKCNSMNDYPAGLDASGGHTSVTQHSGQQAFYHYHIINEYYLNSYIILFGVDLQGTPNVIM